MLLLILFCTVIQASCSEKKALVQPQRGVLDLAGYDIEREGPLSLSGEWEFYWGKTLDDIVREQFTQSHIIRVPAPWSSFRRNDIKLSPHGFASYRLIIKRGKNNGRLSLFVRDIEDSYRIFINGRFAGEVGSFSHDYSFARWSFRHALYRIDDPSDIIEVVIETSNFTGSGGGIITPVTLGTDQQLYARVERSRNIEFFVFGVLIIFGLYHFGLFLMRRLDRSLLFFSLFTFILAVRTLLAGEHSLPGQFPDHYYEFFYAGELATMVVPGLFLFAHLYALFPGIIRRSVRIASFVPGILITVFLFVAPSRFFASIMPLLYLVVMLMSLWILAIGVIALVKRIDGSVIFVSSFLFLSVAVANLIADFHAVVDPMLGFQLALCIFVLCQGVIISQKFSKGYRYNEELSQKLEYYNRNLESIVEERTLELKRSNEELREKNTFLNKLTERLERMAFFDELTQIANKRYFNYFFDTEWKRGARDKSSLSLILIDIDHFKKYNDTYGHLAGDECLAKVAAALKSILNRSGDFVARFGGEEFAVLLPGTDPGGAVSVAERMRDAVASLDIAHQKSSWGNVTISCGVATIIPDTGLTPDQFLSRADTGLYEAKSKGRNRVVYL
jgi:diguanylate cyclase (GGDEF)-like protein